MEYTLENIINLIEEMGFERNSTYDLNSNFTNKSYNEGYIGAYLYNLNVFHLYNDKSSLYFFDVTDNTQKLSFQRLSFDESVIKLIKAFPKELRYLKIKYILEKFGN